MSDWPSAIAAGWHPVAELNRLNNRPAAALLMGERLVLFRSSDGVAVLRDACPHRGAPLSQGRVIDGALACPYHGWRFAGDGRVVAVPGSSLCPAARAAALPVHIAAGLVWTSLAPSPPPFPTLPAAMTDPGLDRFWWPLAASRANLLDALENHLDPAHPHQLHPWLVRAPHRRQPVAVTVRQGPWGAEAIYDEARRNQALLPALLEGQRARSIGRLWPPSIGEVRLEAQSGAFLSIAVVFAPEDTGRTRPWAHFASPRGAVPAFVKRWVLKAFHWPILQQDRRMLAQLQRPPDAYASGPLDFLGPAIWRHANGQPCPEREQQHHIML